MKNFKKIFGLFTILLCMFLLIPKTALSVDSEYKIWLSKNDIDANKKWTITLNSEVDSDTINNKNIVITDELNNRVNTTLACSSNGKMVTVDAPKEGYTPTLAIKDITDKIRKVEQDIDALKVYVTYINNSDDKVSTGDSLTKIVYNNKQYAYDSDFNFERYYQKDIKAPDFIEPTVSADSVIFFKPIKNVDTINLVLNADFEEYRFNNIKVSK